jgi:hypothetical protein
MRALILNAGFRSIELFIGLLLLVVETSYKYHGNKKKMNSYFFNILQKVYYLIAYNLVKTFLHIFFWVYR